MTLLYEPGMVVCFMGTLGSGKTLHMTYQSYWSARMLNIPVYGNYEADFPGFQRPVGTYAAPLALPAPDVGYNRLNGLRHLTSVENGLLAIDEMQSILDSRSFAKNVDITQWLMLIRKMGLGLFYTTQHIDFVDIRLRQITDFVFVHSKAYHFGIKSSIIDVYRMYGNSATFVTKFVLPHEVWMYNLYNTKDRRVKLTVDSYELPFNPDWSNYDKPKTGR